MLSPMSRMRTQTLTRLERRVCLCCGYRGAELQRSATVEVFLCPSCGADLYARPPRSYSEMEGIDAEPQWAHGDEFELPGPFRIVLPDRPTAGGWMRRLGHFIRRLFSRR